MPHLFHCFVTSLVSLPCLVVLVHYFVTSSCCFTLLPHHLAICFMLPRCRMLLHCLATSCYLIALLPRYLMLFHYLTLPQCLVVIVPQVPHEPPICCFATLLPYALLPHYLVPYVGGTSLFLLLLQKRAWRSKLSNNQKEGKFLFCEFIFVLCFLSPSSFWF